MNNNDLFNPEFWESWENDDFRILILKDWEEVKPELPIVKFQIQVPDDYDYFATINVMVDNRIDNMQPDEFVETIKPSLERMIFGFDNYKLLKNTDEHISYYEISYTSMQEGIKLFHNQYLWLLCNKVYGLTFGCEFEAKEEFIPIKNVIFKTFEIK